MKKQRVSELSDRSRSAFQSSYIVGIGASAGGLEALQKLLTALPANTGFPYIIVQHLSPDYKSLLGEILGKYTQMPVISVEDGIEVKPNCVYVIQPGKNMRISGGKLYLSAQRERELNLPIDMFFRSLAEEAGPRAIAIVLSGTGSDGTNGIKEIKERDGLILVQDLQSSKFDGMPRSAIRTGLVDAQISPEEMALELQHISRAIAALPKPLVTEKQADDELMKKIYSVLKQVSNINFTHYKKSTILRRIERRMMLVHKESLADYVSFLYESPEEVKTLSKEVLIGVTSFFRDPEYFQSLKEKAIQNIVIHSIAEDPIRVWVAGCSTGEEAYSIAILFCEVLDALKLKRTVKIFATDLDTEAITTAGKGVFGDNIIDTVSPARLSHYFSRKNNTYVINRDVRKMIVFSPHNVFQDPPFGRLDLISCRNMLIYFQPVLQNDLFAIFHTALNDGGYLFLGKSEAIGAFTDAFPVVDAAAKIFTHRASAKIPGQKAVPFLQTTYMNEGFLDDGQDLRFQQKGIPAELASNEQASIDTALLERFMPCCLVVNDKNDLVHVYGESSNYVHMPVGSFTSNLFELITEGLKIPASTLLKEAREKRKEVQYKDIFFKGERADAEITLSAMPITKQKMEAERLYALVFAENAAHGELPDAVSYDIDLVSSKRITDLEQELGTVQGKLDRSIAEQECVNEELQAANEELLTANEELQSSNEELQSVNEELYTVNSEYQQKLTELADLNDDIANFLSSTLTGIIFVDNKLNIRRYTDYVTTEFSVMDHDIGRSLQFISYHFPKVDITEICENVLKTLVPDEREITTSKNKVFFMRVAPYRSTENKIMGCVITLMDITRQKQGEVKLESAEQKLYDAQYAIEEKSDYLTRIAQELKAPIGALTGLTELTRRSKNDGSALDSALGKIHETVEYMSSIVSKIAEASLSERNAVTQAANPFSVSEMMDHIEELAGPRVQEAGVIFETSVDAGLLPCYSGNKAAVEQILMDFLDSAINSTPRGGAICLKAFEDETVVVPEGQAALRFVLSDTGSGLEKASINELFKPFSHAEGEGSDGGPSGPGMGLSTAMRLVKTMNGSVSVESEVGIGNTFIIRIHVYRYDAQVIGVPVDAAAAEQTPVSLSGCHVLVVEDNSLNRTIIGAIIADAGMTYDEAADGEAAVKAFVDAPEGTYNCILMDMRMPHMDGIRATARIRESGQADAKTVPIIAVSANGYAEDIKKAREAGVNDYTTKPIDREHLLATMQRLMQ